MASYESDSSGDSIEHTITDVMLGYASTGPIDDDFSRLGGSPVSPQTAFVESITDLTRVLDMA